MIGLRQAQFAGRLGLSQPSLPNNVVDPSHEIGLDKVCVGVRQTEIGEYVAVAVLDEGSIVFCPRAKNAANATPATTNH